MADVKRTFWKTVQNLGVIWGLFSVVVIVAGATALHAVYTGSGPRYLGVSHYSQVESIPVAGMVLGPALPGALGFLAPRLFSLGLFAAAFTTLISVALTMTYFCLDLARRDWRFTDDNRLFKIVFAAWIAVPALVAPFWQLPALMKAIRGHGRQPADGAGGRRRDPLLRQPAVHGRVPRQRRPQRCCSA